MAIGRRFLAKAYAAMPRGIQMAAARMFARRKREALTKLLTPRSIILYVTQRCNARCAHCFYWKELNVRVDELSVDEIGRFAKSLKHSAGFSITGGEPFLRSDLDEIVAALVRGNKSREIAFATNGLLTSRIVETCRRTLKLGVENVGVQVSLDGLEKTHNAIRAVPAFKPAIDTIRQLAALAKEDGRFSVHVSCCIQKRNFGELREFVEHMIPLGVPLQFALIRGESFGTWNVPGEESSGIDPRDEDSPRVPLPQLEEFFGWLTERNAECAKPFWSAQQQDKIELSLRMMREEKKCIACYAGVLDAVVYANGDVALCELTKPVGNLRDFGMDMSTLWASAAADEMRKKIKACFCIHGCNLVTGLMFRPEHIREAILRKAK